MPETYAVDIVVIGGGSAGICASVAAARKGASVVLIERWDKLGGMGTLAMVQTFCGLYYPDVSLPPQLANPGLPTEIEQLSRERTGAEPVKMGKVYVLPQHPDVFASITQELTSAESSLDVWLNTSCTEIAQHPDESFTVYCGERSVTCRALIDTSADAIVAGFLGATRYSTPPEKTQRAAFIFSLQNVGLSAADESFRMRLALEIVHAVEAKELSRLALGTACRASTKHGEIFFTTDLDPAEATELLSQGHFLANQLTEFLRRKFPEFSEASEPQLAAQPGIRETFRWKGCYTLTAEDLIEGTAFPDAIAFATWPIELRENTKGPRLTYFNQPVPAQIPLRSLVSAEINGVFFAGRCISATHEALASVRVMGTCFATGQAAGQAAVDYLTDEKLTSA